MQISKKAFLELLSQKTGSIKGVLMDQHNIAGLGNLYSDEMLYQSKVHPQTKSNKISKAKKELLFENMNLILETVIKEESVRKNLPETYLIHHREAGAKCPSCAGNVKKIKVSGRSTYICPSCQKEEK